MIKGWIQDNKLIVFLGSFLFIFVIAFFVATSDKSEMIKAITECNEKLKEFEKNSTTPKPQVATTTTTSTTIKSSTTKPGETTASTTTATGIVQNIFIYVDMCL